MGVFARLVPAPVFKTGEGFGNRLLVGSIPMHSRQSSFGDVAIVFAVVLVDLKSRNNG